MDSLVSLMLRYKKSKLCTVTFLQAPEEQSAAERWERIPLSR